MSDLDPTQPTQPLPEGDDPNRSQTAPRAEGPTDTPAPGAYGSEAYTGVPDKQSTLQVGDPVKFTYKDAADNDIVRHGTVVELVDNANGHDPATSPHDSAPVTGARVAWLGDVSDPIPLDQLEQSR